MQRILLLVSFLLISGLTAQAQCTPDTSIHVNGIYPDTATGLPHASMWQTYSTVIQVKVVRDTSYSGLPAQVDSFVITGVSGLPSGFSYSCYPANCQFPGGSNGCILLYSNGPVTNPVGNYPIVVQMSVYGHVTLLGALSLPVTVGGYSITVDAGTGISGTALPTRLSVSEFVPNPVTSNSKLVIGVPQRGPVRIETLDLLGNVVRSENIEADLGWNTYALQAEDLRSGVYLTKVYFGKDVAIRRMVVTSH